MASSKKFQAPRGTRDFYPADMAVRRYIEGVWRTASINHGFDEVEGPTIEHIDLYTHKSGPGIVNELFQVYSGKDEQQIAAIRAGDDAPYALRPEFTPTLARMVVAKAAQLPKPIKWFAIPGHYRAERPQRGRLREFIQWNVDYVGGEDDPARADAEVIACAVGALEKFGLGPGDVKVHVFDRRIAESRAKASGVEGDRFLSLLWLIDNMGKLSDEQIRAEVEKHGITQKDVLSFQEHFRRAKALSASGQPMEQVGAEIGLSKELVANVAQVMNNLGGIGLGPWLTFDPDIVRGLAYYTGTVFEIIAEGERAVAGGGRYDRLIESFGGPSMPACGFGMGDVVLGLLLHDKGLLPEEVYMQPLRPHVFVIAASDDTAAKLPAIVARLRKAGLHVRHSYRSTRNVGKLLGEAGKAFARTAIILGEELAAGRVALKDLDGGEQREVALDELETVLRQLLDAQERAGV
jgi:histidyl-tRNA synthetase